MSALGTLTALAAVKLGATAVAYKAIKKRRESAKDDDFDDLEDLGEKTNPQDW